jgi:hypothetical protein
VQVCSPGAPVLDAGGAAISARAVPIKARPLVTAMTADPAKTKINAILILSIFRFITFPPLLFLLLSLLVS